MIIDCDRCAIKGVGCSDCVISVLLDAPPRVEFDEPELRALGTLADAGLVPRLRLVPVHGGRLSPGVAVDTPMIPEPEPTGAERSEANGERTRRQVS
ncbi:MAG TPA: hypothetical protein VHW44_04490 [Pseudonocardiaceae bacterium]|jgi:hypothetical protein|nr:hypothetical protein [Pseudonocardiaceae bacterium]